MIHLDYHDISRLRVRAPPRVKISFLIIFIFWQFDKSLIFGSNMRRHAVLPSPVYACHLSFATPLLITFLNFAYATKGYRWIQISFLVRAFFPHDRRKQLSGYH